MRVFGLAGLLCGLILSPSLACAADVETQKSEAGVRAVETHWVRAFLTGDGDYLNVLLDADYASVNEHGMARPKANIIALAKRIAASGPQTIPAPSPTMKVVVHGNAAVVTDSAMEDTSVDVFHYENGAWHAWYSQHTGVSAPEQPKKS